MKHMFPDSVFWTGWHWTWASAGGALPTATPSSNFALGAREPKIWRGIDSRKGIEEGGILRGLSVRDIGAFAVIFVVCNCC